MRIRLRFKVVILVVLSDAGRLSTTSKGGKRIKIRAVNRLLTNLSSGFLRKKLTTSTVNTVFFPIVKGFLKRRG